jgi:HlyD family secretion protein
MRTVLTLIIGLVVGLAGGAFIGYNRANAQAASTQAAVTTTAEAKPPAPPTTVLALGRLRPRNGIIRVAGPSTHVGVVLSEMLVEEGQRVERGQTIAYTDNHKTVKAALGRLQAQIEAQRAAIARYDAELRTARSEFNRFSQLHQQGTVSDSQRDTARLNLEAAEANVRRGRAELSLAQAELQRAREDLELTVIRAPITGQVLKVHTRAGEKVVPEGIVELADNEQMYAIAEVYETDVSRIQVGQKASIKSPSVAQPLSGVVERIGLKIGKMDVLGTDPAAKTDARVVEVEVRLDDSVKVSAATNLQVEVMIDVASPVVVDQLSVTPEGTVAVGSETAISSKP